jgi:hypothetical protein
MSLNLETGQSANRRTIAVQSVEAFGIFSGAKKSRFIAGC